MQIKVDHPSALGPIVRACRKSQRVRQDEAADSIGVSENFLGKVEKGGDSVNWGKLFQVLQGLGVHVILDVPADVARMLEQSSNADSTR
ncbi:MAG TPA: helix-turn-helix domain-containing protein [Limnobacter sp.]|uniref:helix-turn-helix domain-containing protein n=1 Tax=Limnobacter sp. TaxID=2003368 RepID=UPI002EDAA894